MSGKTRTTPDNMIKIDGNKLYEQFKERGLVTAKICNDVGVNSGYFSNAKHRGRMANMMIVVLESRYGIPRDTYVITEKSEQSVVEVIPKEDFFTDENRRILYKIVYSAVYNAVKLALNE